MAKIPKKKKKTVKKKKKVSVTKKKPSAVTKKKHRPLEEIVTEQLAPAQEALDRLIPATGAVVSEAQDKLVGQGERASDIDDFADGSQERSSIISMVRGFEEQVETAFALKEVLEAELDTTQRRLAQEVAARSELEAQVELLQTHSALAEQLREDMSFVEQERNSFADELANTRPQLEQALAERDSLAKQIASVDADAEGFQAEKKALEAQVTDLQNKIGDADSLRKELTETTQAYQRLREQHHDLQDANRELMGTSTRLENEIRRVNADYEAAKKKLKALKVGLSDIRSEAMQTSRRIRHKYSKPNHPKKSKQVAGNGGKRN
jgi:chromosome segregation ATPase